MSIKRAPGGSKKGRIVERHGLKYHPLYQTWASMKNRCLNVNHNDFKWYGAKGVSVCDEWMHSPSAFITYMEDNFGPKPPGHSLDRIDVFGNYEPGNVKWSTQKEQVANQRKKKQACAAMQLQLEFCCSRLEAS